MRRSLSWLTAAMLMISTSMLGQSAQVTSAALYRTFMIQTSKERGTAFSIDVDGREYFITAKHLFTGVKTGPAGEYKEENASVHVLGQRGQGVEGHLQQWILVSFKVIDPGKDIDILILVPPQLEVPRGSSLKFGSAGVPFGGDCEFLGFPYGGGWNALTDKNDWLWLPYVKHCTISAELRDASLRVWVLDGINNEGFSGGPVVFGTGNNQQVFAVVQGFHTEPVEVLPEDSPGRKAAATSLGAGSEPDGEKKEVVNVNSGFITAFDIQPAIDAIRKNPIGPVITTP